MDGLLEGLAQDVLSALGVGNQAVHRQGQVVGYQGVGSRKEPKTAHDDTTLIVTQPLRVLPKHDVCRHVDFLRHPVICTPVQVFLPGPVIFQWNQLVQVRSTIDHALFIDGNPSRGPFQLIQALVELQ